MTHVTCRLTAKNRDQLRNPTLGNRVWATFTFLDIQRYRHPDEGDVAVCIILQKKLLSILDRGQTNGHRDRQTDHATAVAIVHIACFAHNEAA